jgi:metal-dependent amidase/aminoacylase/carboxypeptidase family protein
VAKLGGTIRYFKDDIYELAADRVQKICDGFAVAHDVKVELELRNVFDVLVNDAALSDAYLAAAAEIVGPENIIHKVEPKTGSEDFADMLKIVPGAYCVVGHGGTVPLHNPSFVLDEDILPIGASIMARMLETRLPVSDG